MLARFPRLKKVPQEAVMAKTSRINSQVECMLHRLDELFPHTLGGPYDAFGLGMLHTYGLGIAPKWSNFSCRFGSTFFQPVECMLAAAV